MIDSVNGFPLWGLPKRTIKLSNATWERRVYGRCFFYFSVDFDFEINYKTWDRDVPSVGKKCLEKDDEGEPIGSILKPTDFVQYQDNKGENSECFHKQDGTAAESIEDAVKLHIERHPEANFLLLGVPTFLG
jgi:hypothetical protein